MSQRKEHVKGKSQTNCVEGENLSLLSRFLSLTVINDSSPTFWRKYTFYLNERYNRCLSSSFLVIQWSGAPYRFICSKHETQLCNLIIYTFLYRTPNSLLTILLTIFNLLTSKEKTESFSSFSLSHHCCMVIVP